MAFRDLREFIRLLEQKGQLRRISTPVSAELEITEIADRVSKARGPALLFESVQGYDVPVLINAFGSMERMAWALGVNHLNDLSARVREVLKLAQGPMPSSLLDKLKSLGNLSQLASYSPKVVANAPCQEVVLTDDASLDRFPILKCWPEDGGPYITLPLVVTADPVTGRRNVGMYRMQVYDSRTTGMHWHIHKGGAQHCHRSEKARQRLEVAVAIGPDPATTYAATAPLPPDLDEFMFAGFLRQEALELVKCKTVNLHVPAHSEIVLEGHVDPEERRLEGPFGDHTGYYSLPDMYPVFHLTAITHRRQPIYPATVVGRPPMEDYYFGKATERLFLPLIQLVLPEVVDINMPPEGVFHNLVIVSIRKEYPGHTRKVMYALWGMMQMMLTKALIVVDDHVDVQDVSAVAWRVANNVDPRRDIVIVEGPLDALDHSSPFPHYGSKIGIDATKKGSLDGHNREWPPEIEMRADIKELVDRKWREYGI